MKEMRKVLQEQKIFKKIRIMNIIFPARERVNDIAYKKAQIHITYRYTHLKEGKKAEIGYNYMSF